MSCFVASARARVIRAFTLLEVFVVVAVIGILAILLLPVFAKLRARAQRTQCAANLRSLYVAANLCVQENGAWPQIAMSSSSDAPERDYASGWIAALTPFGPTQKTWICPAIQELAGNPDLSQPENARVDYIATAFDDTPTSPHQWPRQPWFGEIANVHGNGNLIVFTDGSISDLKTVTAKQRGK